MQVEIKEVEYCKVQATYLADPEVVKNKKNEFIQELRKFKIPGFRKGKAPDHVIMAKMGKKIIASIVEQMKAQAYDDIVFESEFKPIGYPKFEDVKIDGDNFSCKMIFIKKPDFALKDLKFEIPKPVLKTDIESFVQKTIQDIRVNFGEVRPFEENDIVEKGDNITIGFEATIDNEPFEGGKVEGELYQVNNESFPEFDEHLIGMRCSEQKTFSVKFPDSFENIGGKTAVFNLTVFMGTKTVPKALDDDLAKVCGYETLDDLINGLRVSYSNKAQQELLLNVKQQVISRLLAEHEFIVPGVLVDLETQHLAIMNQVNLKDLSDDEREQFRKLAEQQVRLSLILDSIREKNPESVLSDIDAKTLLLNRAASNNKNPEEFLEEASKNGTLVGLISSLRDEYTIQWVIDQVTLVE